MIQVIVCAHKHNVWETHYDHIDTTIGCDYTYVRIDNTENSLGIGAAYNKGVRASTGEILVFVHSDVFFITKNWGAILEKKFEKDPALGCIGVAGTQYLFHDNASWVAPGCPYLQGKVVHRSSGDIKNILTVYSQSKSDKTVVAVDGLFFAVRKKLFKTCSFDEKKFDRFHFYDLDICMQIRKTHRIIVTPDIFVKHLSEGVFDSVWKTYESIFLQKYTDELPASCVETVPDRTKRIPFLSYNLETIVSAKTFVYIDSLGKPLFSKDKKGAMSNKRLVVVTGMHRSGTSCIAGLLDLCGFSLGSKNLLLGRNQPKDDNKKGLNENSYVTQTNDAILTGAGGQWFAPPSQEGIMKNGKRWKIDMQRFENIFQGNLIKDPRFCLTLPLWKKYCPAIQTVILCFRYPYAVAQSLKKRDGISIEAGLELWYEYNIRFLNNLPDVFLLVVNYDDLEVQLDNDLFDILTLLHSPMTKEVMCTTIQGYYEKKLNHHRNEEETAQNPLPEHIASLYTALVSRSISSQRVML